MKCLVEVAERRTEDLLEEQVWESVSCQDSGASSLADDMPRLLESQIFSGLGQLLHQKPAQKLDELGVLTLSKAAPARFISLIVFWCH